MGRGGSSSDSPISVKAEAEGSFRKEIEDRVCLVRNEHSRGCTGKIWKGESSADLGQAKGPSNIIRMQESLRVIK